MAVVVCRSTGLELSVQQRFKWVQLRCDQEPMRCLLHRHLLRRLAHAHHGVMPMPDNSVYKVLQELLSDVFVASYFSRKLVYLASFALRHVALQTAW